MEKEFIKRGFHWKSLQIFGFVKTKGWCTHFSFQVEIMGRLKLMVNGLLCVGMRGLFWMGEKMSILLIEL